MQGLVMFSLYMMGIVGAFFAALVLRRTVTKGASSGFMMEMPKYQWPRARDVLIGLYQRAWIFLRRAGTIILFSTIILWALLSFPKPPAGSDISEVNYSVAGRIANTITPARSEEHTSELQSLMRISYADFCLKNKKIHIEITHILLRS